jgi:hypothetical protein
MVAWPKQDNGRHLPKMLHISVGQRNNFIDSRPTTESCPCSRGPLHEQSDTADIHQAMVLAGQYAVSIHPGAQLRAAIWWLGFLTGTGVVADSP